MADKALEQKRHLQKWSVNEEIRLILHIRPKVDRAEAFRVESQRVGVRRVDHFGQGVLIDGVEVDRRLIARFEFERAEVADIQRIAAAQLRIEAGNHLGRVRRAQELCVGNQPPSATVGGKREEVDAIRTCADEG